MAGGDVLWDMLVEAGWRSADDVPTGTVGYFLSPHQLDYVARAYEPADWLSAVASQYHEWDIVKESDYGRQLLFATQPPSITGVPTRHPRRRRDNPRKLLKAGITPAKLWQFIKVQARETDEAYYLWLRQNADDLKRVIHNELATHYTERAALTPRTRKQREADIAGSMHKAHKTGSGDKRRVYLMDAETKFLNVTPEQKQLNRYSPGSSYTYLSRLDDGQLAILWGLYEAKMKRRKRAAKQKREAPAEAILPPGPWDQIPATAQRQVRQTLVQAEMLDQLAMLWPHARVHREDAPRAMPWHSAFQAAIDEASQEVLDAIEQDPATADIEVSHDSSSGTLLQINTELPRADYKALVSGNGFRWSRKEQFAYRPKSRGKRKPTLNIRRLLHEITNAGYTVAYIPPRDLDLDRAIAGARAAAEQAAERHGARAAKKQAESDSAYAASRSATAGIPMGQPILVDHSSAKRHRRDLARSDKAMRKAMELSKSAARSAHRAQSAEARAGLAGMRREKTVSGQTIRIPKRLWNWLLRWKDDASEASRAVHGDALRSDRGSMRIPATPSVFDALDHYIGMDGLAFENEYYDLASKDRTALKRQAEQVWDQVRDLKRAMKKNPRAWINHTPGMPVDTLEAFGGPDNWTADRAALHRGILQQILDQEPVPEGMAPQAVIMMGGTASGKSSALKGLDTAGLIHLDSDDIKARLPEYLIARAANARDAAAVVHEESSYLAKKALREAIDLRLNLIFDGTGRNAAKYARMINQLKGAGYNVKLIFVHVRPEIAIPRALARAERTGRYVPESFIEGAYAEIPYNFGGLTRFVDSWLMFDTSEFPVRFVAQRELSGPVQVHKPQLYTAFLRDFPQRGGAVPNPPVPTNTASPAIDTDDPRLVRDVEAAINAWLWSGDDDVASGLDMFDQLRRDR